MRLKLGDQEKSVRKLRRVIKYIASHYGGTEAHQLMRKLLKQIMPMERPELREL